MRLDTAAGWRRDHSSCSAAICLSALAASCGVADILGDVLDAVQVGAVEEALAHIKGCDNISLVLNKSRSWLGKAQFGTYYGYPGR